MQPVARLEGKVGARGRHYRAVRGGREMWPGCRPSGGRSEAFGQGAAHLDGFGNVGGSESGVAGQIGDGAGDAQGAMHAAGAPAQTDSGCLHEGAGLGGEVQYLVEPGTFEPRMTTGPWW